MINLFQPRVGEPELNAIADVFASNWLGNGKRVECFERDFGEYVGCPAGEMLAVASCTEGLFQAVDALGIGPGDEVVLPTISFVGAAHAVRATGADVVLCDVDPLTLNPTSEHVESALTSATKAVLILHYGGIPGAVAEIASLAKRHGLFLIEDAACALGSFHARRACGTFGEVGVWSFDAAKLLTTGDGGMVHCRSEATAERIRRNVRMGVGSAGFDRRGRSDRWWEIDPLGIGRRATMNDVSGAMGVAQLKRLPDFVSRRDRIAASYDKALAELSWLRPRPQPEEGTVTFYYWVQAMPTLRDELAEYLLERDIYTSFRYWPLHKTRMYRGRTSFPGADRAAASTLLLPVHQSLSDGEIEWIVDAIRSFRPGSQ
jgi:aminotransferase